MVNRPNHFLGLGWLASESSRMVSGSTTAEDLYSANLLLSLQPTACEFDEFDDREIVIS